MGFNVDATYKITFQYRGEEVQHVLRQPGINDLRQFEATKKEVLKLKNKEGETAGNSAKAYSMLYDILGQSACGYKNIPQELDDDGWKKLVPARHKIEVAKVFGKIQILEDDEVVEKFGLDSYLKTSGENVVHLGARQNGEECLCSHIFLEPEIEDITEYEAVVATSKIKWSKKGTNIILLEPVEKLNQLYNRIIERVEGYTEVEKDRIPVMHKIVAIKEFMRSAAECIEEAAGN